LKTIEEKALPSVKQLEKYSWMMKRNNKIQSNKKK
jgi:hypothetical protein